MHNARSLPPRTCAIAGSVSEKMNWICPPSRSVIASPPPLYGTSTAWTLVRFLSISLDRCEMLPGPLVP